MTPSYFYPSSQPAATTAPTAKVPASTSPSNTAKVSSTATLQQRPGLTFAEPVNSPPRDANREASPPLCVQSAERKMSLDKDKRRRRRSSSLMYQEPPESLEQMSDQATMPNLNSQWVNAKGMMRNTLNATW